VPRFGLLADSGVMSTTPRLREMDVQRTLPPRSGHPGSQRHPRPSATLIAGAFAVATIVLAAALSVYMTGVGLVYVGVVSPGGPTLLALAYLGAIIFFPALVGRQMRMRWATWLHTIAVCAGIILGVSLLFFPLAIAEFCC
jgi:hypothetical protein